MPNLPNCAHAPGTEAVANPTINNKQLCCLVLAAGSGRRFGADKRRAPMADGRSLLQTTLDNIPAVFGHYLLVVQPDDSDELVDLSEPWKLVRASKPELGMGHSLACGIAALPPCNGVIVILGDMPWVAPSTITQLASLCSSGALVIPTYKGKRGNPVAIGSHFFNQLLNATGDKGARELFTECAQAVIWLDCEDPGILRDVDTPAALIQ